GMRGFRADRPGGMKKWFAGIGGNRFRVPFRVALSTVFMALLIGAVAVTGVLSYRNMRKNADQLSSQVLDQTSLRIESWIGNLLSRANDQSQLNRSMLGEMQQGPETFHRLGVYWRRVMETHPYFTFLSVRLETGHSLSIERLKDGSLSIRESRLDRERSTLAYSDFRPEDHKARKPYDRGTIRFDGTRGGPSWYLKAAEANRPIWIPARTLRKGAETVAGVSFAAPFFGPEGEVRGVTTVDFDIVAISSFLAANPVGKAGYAFIIESPPQEEPRIIAHPTPGILTRTAVGRRGTPRYEFVPVGELSDRRVARFMESLPRGDSEGRGDGLRIFRFSDGKKDYFGSYRKLTGENVPDWGIASIIPREEILGLVDRNNLETLGIGLAVFLLILLASAWVSGLIADPLRRIARQTESIGRFELDSPDLGQSRIKEVDQLMASTDGMKRGLRSFAKYVPSDVVRDILSSGGEAEIGGRRAYLTFFFSDLVGFTSIAERMPAEPLVAQLSEYLGEMDRQIRHEKGTVDKFLGDGVMAFWGAPSANAEHALAACRAALLCQERLAGLRETWKAEGKPLLFQGIGINTGEAVVGNMGSSSRMNYTVVGDPVNTASRLERLNRYYGTRIILSQTTRDLVKDHFVTRPLDLVSVKGRRTAVKIYELMGSVTTCGEKDLRIAEWTAAALDAYLSRRFDEAIEQYGKVLLLDSGDRTARIMLDHCRICREGPLPDDWRGIRAIE
ncbi:MAG: adenylate cyclase, partial [Deltaproteobacteria bacterium]|nr:adenylate cyclase [Deltaproteobacteria bacterium]